MKQKGFTLIELVIVIVILGILAATALPKFADLRGDAAKAAVDGVAGALNSAFSANYGTCMINITNTTDGRCVRFSAAAQACNSSDTPRILTGGLPGEGGYTISNGTRDCSSAVSGGPAGQTLACTISRTGSGTTQTAPFTLICTG